MKDFFTRYHQSRSSSFIIPGIFALVFSFAIVGLIREGGDFSLTQLSANVVEGMKPTPQYDADLLIEQEENTVTLRMGKGAKTVESVSLDLLSDPTRLRSVQTGDPHTSIQTGEPGMYSLTITRNGKDIQAGEVLSTLTLDIDRDTSLAPVNAKFLSSGASYSLSVKSSTK